MHQTGALINSIKHTIRTFFADKHNKIVIRQPPNALLWTWIVLTILSHIVKSDPVNQISRIAATIALLIWALLEVRSGASPFRRALGVVVLVYIFVQWLR